MRHTLKKHICAVLAAVLLFSLFPTVSAYTGVADWAKPEVTAMDELGLIPESLAQADMRKNISRLDMCRVAVLAYEKLKGKAIPQPENHPFTDTTDPSVEKAWAAGIVGGYGDGTFRPSKNLTRLEFFAIVAQFLSAVQFPVSEDDYGDISRFSDSGSIPWGADHAKLTVGLGIVNGSGSILDWRSATSHQQGLALFYRTYQVVLPMFEDSDASDESKAIATGTFHFNGYLRVRSGPGTGYDEVGQLKHGDRIEIFEIVTVGTTQWGRISNGWICLDYVILDQASKGEEVVALAKKYLGYSYVYAGKSPEDGFDCSGFVYYIYKQFGYTLSPGATNQWNKLSDRKVLSQDELIPGDLVFFSGNGQVSGMEHVGIYIGDGQFIHAANPSKGVIITALSESYYASRYLGGKRVIVD